MPAELQYSPDVIKLGVVGGTAFLTSAAIVSFKKAPRPGRRKKFDPWRDPIEATTAEAVVASSVAMGALYLGVMATQQGLLAMGYTRAQIEDIAQFGFLGSATLGLVKLALEAKKRTT